MATKRKRKRAYGSGEIVPPRTVGGTWGVRYGPRDRRRFEGGFPSREMAENVLALRHGDAVAGRAGLPKDPKAIPTLQELAAKFLERRERTHAAHAEDSGRWKNHLAPTFGHLKPADVDQALIRRFVEAKLAEGLASGTIRICVALLSGLFTDLIERGLCQKNPARDLPRSTARLIKPSHDPRTTPFVEKLGDVDRIYRALPEPLNTAYAIGAMAGLRTGEVFGLRWRHVDLASRRIHVRESVKGPLKDKESRIVPVLDGLLPILTAWKLKSGGEGEARVIPPMRKDGGKIHKATPGKYLRAALKELGLERDGLGWYECTRHTFASQWVINGGSIEKLKEILGHYSVVVTERYAHLRVDLFSERDLGTIPLTLGTAPGELWSLAKSRSL